MMPTQLMLSLIHEIGGMISNGTGNVFWDEAIRDAIVASFSVLTTAIAGYKVYMMQRKPEERRRVISELAGNQIALQGALYEFLMAKIDLVNFRVWYNAGIYVETALKELSAASMKSAELTRVFGNQLSILNMVVAEIPGTFALSEEIKDIMRKALNPDYPEVGMPNIEEIKNIMHRDDYKMKNIGEALSVINTWYEEAMQNAKECAIKTSSQIGVLKNELSRQVSGYVDINAVAPKI